jgi:hypothetical protein
VLLGLEGVAVDLEGVRIDHLGQFFPGQATVGAEVFLPTTSAYGKQMHRWFFTRRTPKLLFIRFA